MQMSSLKEQFALQMFNEGGDALDMFATGIMVSNTGCKQKRTLVTQVNFWQCYRSCLCICCCCTGLFCSFKKAEKSHKAHGYNATASQTKLYLLLLLTVHAYAI